MTTLPTRQQNDALVIDRRSRFIKSCDQCKAQFRYSHSETKYCSYGCGQTAKRKREKYWIGKEHGRARVRVQPKAGQIASRQMNDGRIDQVPPKFRAVCAVCGNLFMSQNASAHHCSKSCGRRAWRKRRQNQCGTQQSSMRDTAVVNEGQGSN